MNQPPLHVLVLPGLQGSGPDHWQTWLEGRFNGAVRIQMADWSDADLDRWVRQIDATLDDWTCANWLVVAHSFGCLALARWAAVSRTERVRSALLVAPANPARFGIAPSSLDRRLPFQSTVVSSRNDPWFEEAGVRELAQSWGAGLVDAGAVGHLNPESGHGPWPLGAQLVDDELYRLHHVSPETSVPSSTPPRTQRRLHFAI